MSLVWRPGYRCSEPCCMLESCFRTQVPWWIGLIKPISSSIQLFEQPVRSNCSFIVLFNMANLWLWEICCWTHCQRMSKPCFSIGLFEWANQLSPTYWPGATLTMKLHYLHFPHVQLQDCPIFSAFLAWNIVTVMSDLMAERNLHW